MPVRWSSSPALGPALAALAGPARVLRALVLDGPDRVVTARLARLTSARRHAEALAVVERELPARHDHLPFLRAAHASAVRAGALTLQVELARSTAAVAPRSALAGRLHQLEGQLRETSSTWEPTVPGEPEPVEPTTQVRVLHLLKVSLPYRQSGYTVRTAELLAAERAAGRDPVAMTALDFPRSLGVDAVPEDEEVAGVRHLRLDRGHVPLHQPPDGYLEDWASAAAPRVRAERPAVLHVHSGHRGYETALVGLALGRHAGLPVVYEVRGFFESMWTSDQQWAARAELTRRRRDTDSRCMRAADAVVTLSETMRAEIVARGVPAERVHVVPNGVDVAAFEPRPPRPDLLAHYGLAGRFVLGYVSNLDHPREGQELLVRAAVALRRRGVPATALLVGDGQRRPQLERLARRLRAGDAVVFTGRVPHADVLGYYALIDLFVVPRQDEHAARLVTPLKPYEAMAAGVPLLVSDLSALREVAGDGRGRTFTAGDLNSLVQQVLALHADAAGRAAMAARARAWVVAERSWARSAEGYARVYEQVLRGRRAERGSS